jgi:hypothetical protein
VLQSGGDEGMWTFDRYQRWMEQVQDWVRPTQAATPRVSAEGNMTQRAAGLRQGIPPLPTAPMQSAPTTRPVQKKPGPASPAPADDVFEVPAEDMDLAQLAELAKKVVERK